MSNEGKIFSSDYYFSGTPSERGQTKKLLQYIQSQGHQKIALLYSNNAWAQGYVNILKDELQKTQVTIVEELKVNENVSDFKTELTRMKKALYIQLLQSIRMQRNFGRNIQNDLGKRQERLVLQFLTI